MTDQEKDVLLAQMRAALIQAHEALKGHAHSGCEKAGAAEAHCRKVINATAEIEPDWTLIQ